MVNALAGVLLGVVLGSFIASLTLRWPVGRGLGGRSRCECCDHVLGAVELVPVLSYLALRGRCRHCAAVIAPRHVWIELAAGGIGGASLGAQPGLAGLVVAGFGWLLLTLAILDAEHFWLPDRLTLGLGLAGLALGFWLAPALDARLIGAGAGYLSLAGIAAAYRWRTGRDGLGGGDPKLLAGIGAWLGWQALPMVVLAAAVLGLLLAGVDRLRGGSVTGQTRLPLGALLAATAWPLAVAAWPMGL